MEKNKIPCKIIEDLLPSYMDEILSDSVKEAVELHLATCDSCSEKLKDFKRQQEQALEQEQKKELAFIKGIKRYKYYAIGMAIGAGIPLMALLVFILWALSLS